MKSKFLKFSLVMKLINLISNSNFTRQGKISNILIISVTFKVLKQIQTEIRRLMVHERETTRQTDEREKRQTD